MVANGEVGKGRNRGYHITSNQRGVSNDYLTSRKVYRTFYKPEFASRQHGRGMQDQKSEPLT